MKQVQKTVGRWVQRIAGQRRNESSTLAPRPLVELDSKALRQVSGGTNESPYKGW